MQFGQSLDDPTLSVNVSRERAGLMGVEMAEISRSLVAATSSSRFVVPIYWADPNSGVAYQIQVQVPQATMDSVEELDHVARLESAHELERVDLEPDLRLAAKRNVVREAGDDAVRAAARELAGVGATVGAALRRRRPGA